MKKYRFIRLFSIFLCLVILFSCGASIAFGYNAEKETTVSVHIQEYSDGSYDVIAICQNDPGYYRAFTYGSISTSHYTSSNVLVWTVKLFGTFSYNGSSSNCVNAYTTVDFYESGWSVLSESTGHSGNTAYNSVELGKNILGITHTMERLNQSLSCDKDGNLSSP